jgi:hypothetical protein
MFLSVDVALNVDYTRVRKLILVLGARMIIVELVLLLVSELDIAFNSLIGSFDYCVSYCLLHQVNFALTDQLHVRVCQRYQELLCVVFSPQSQSFRLIGAWGTLTLFHGRKYEERVRLCAEVEVLGEWALQQELGVVFHLQQIVLLLPYERDTFKLPH